MTREQAIVEFAKLVIEHVRVDGEYTKPLATWFQSHANCLAMLTVRGPKVLFEIHESNSA